MCSKKSTGLSSSTAARRSAFASAGIAGATILIPGTPMNHEAGTCEWIAPNRLVVVEEGPLTGGWAGEVLALAAEHGLGDIDDAWRIATPDTPIPYSPPLEDAHLPGAARIAAEVERRLR